MTKPGFQCAPIIMVALAVVIATSCNNTHADIPFPVSDSVYAQPVSQPLQFTVPKKLNWVTIKTGGIKPTIKKLDIETLPGEPYDTSGFEPFTREPEETHFNWDSLPDSAFSLASLPSKPIKFKTSVLQPPTISKSAAPSQKSGTALSIFSIGRTQGLEGKQVNSLLKDKSGLIWTATDLGLYHFDGEFMQTYNSLKGIKGMVEDNYGRIWFVQQSGFGMIDPPNGTISRSAELKSNFISNMMKDDKGRIWVSNLSDSGITVIDPVTKSFKHLDEKTGLSGSTPWAAMEDADKNIWITNYSDRIEIINLEKGKLKHLRMTGSHSMDTLFGPIITDKLGNAWLSDINGGIDMVDIKKGTIKYYNEFQGIKTNDFKMGLLNDNIGRIWITSSLRGITIVDPGKGMAKHINKDDGLNHNFISSIILDDNKRVWVATFQGVNMIEQNGDAVHLSKSPESTLLEDSKGRIWNGTAGNGIEIFDAKKHFVRYLKPAQGLAHVITQSISEMDGKIWIANDGGLDVIDPIHKTLEHTGKKEGLYTDGINEITRDAKGNLWIGERVDGVELIDAANKKVLHAGIKDGLSDAHNVGINRDKYGRIWLATSRGGVEVIDPEKGEIKYLNNAPGLKDTCNRILMPDENGSMWIGTDKGIYIADQERGTLISITTKEGLPNNRVSSLLSYKGRVIASVAEKICIITPPKPADVKGTAGKSAEQWKITLLAGSESLYRTLGNWNSDFITGEGQYLWGDNGITIINEIKEQEDGPPNHTTGITVMNHAKYFANKPNLNEHDTLWTADSFYVKGQTPINPGFGRQDGINWDSVSGPYNMPVNLRIPHDQNYLQFQFAEERAGRQDTSWYCYMLQGIDRQWSSFTSKTNTENYLNLSPGDYTFKVSSKSLSGHWTKPDSFSFTIMPPWWQTWWAYAFYGICALAAIYFTDRIRRKVVIERERAKTRERELAQAKEIEKAYTELKATQSQLIQSEKMASLGELTAGIAHEIQNPLNFVNNFSEVNKELIIELKAEIEKGNIEEVKSIADNIETNEEKISHHGKRADAIVKGMLQHSRSGTGVKEPTDINVLADEYLRLAYHGLRAKDKLFNATMKTNFDSGIGKINIIPQDIGRVLLNLYNNAFYALAEKSRQNPEGYEPTITVNSQKLPDKIEISVKDNGNGIPQKVVDKIFQPFFTTKPAGQGTGLGLSLSYDIVKAHGGEIKVNTIDGGFTEFVIHLPTGV